jgi:hypothetical protein
MRRIQFEVGGPEMGDIPRIGEEFVATDITYAHIGEGLYLVDMKFSVTGTSAQADALWRIAHNSWNDHDECTWCGVDIDDEHTAGCAATWAAGAL